MTAPRGWIAFVVAAALVAGGACGSDPDGGVGDGSPSTPDEIPLLDGGAAELGEGRPVVVAFVAEWCTPCRRELPLIETVYQNHIGEVDVIAVGFQEDESATRSLAADTGITFPLGSDPDGELFRDFGFVQLPATVVVGADGQVVESFASGVTDEDLEGVLAPIL